MNIYDEIKSWLEYIKTHKDKTNKAEYLIRILETVLADRERLFKDNQIFLLQNSPALKIYIDNNYISKDKIKEKIEELKNENYQISQESEIAFDSGIMKNNFKIQVLKELLKEGE